MRFLRISALAAAALAALMLSACGRTGDIIPPGTVTPAQVMDLHAESRAGTVVLAWTMPAKNADGSPLTDLAGFDVMRAELPEGSEGCPCEFAPAGKVDLEFPGNAVVKGKRAAWRDPGAALVPGRRYAYTVRPFNKDGYEGPASNTATLSFLLPPVPPQGLYAEAGNRRVLLSWRAVPGGATGYNVYRADAPGEPLARPLNSEPVTGTEYEDTGLSNGKDYYYRVSAIAGNAPPYSESAPTDEAKAVPADTEPPQTPYGLQAVPSEGMVLLSWLPNAEEDLKGYVLYRQAPGDETPMPLPGMPTSGITYEDRDVTPDTTYTYAVSAVDNATPPNESPVSEPFSARVPAP